MTGSGRPVGLFAYAETPECLMTRARTRALLAEASLQGVDLLLFSAVDCDLEAGTVDARHWQDGGLQPVRTPLPPLVMIVSHPMRPGHRAIGAWLRANADVVDDRGADKLDLVRLLQASPLAAHAIPADRLDPDRFTRQAAEWTARGGGAVVKPLDGMRGGNVHFLLPSAGGAWLLRSGTTATEGPLSDMIALLHRRVAARLGYRAFMIQDYVASTHRDMSLAFRVEVTKTPAGDWRMTRRLARIGVTGVLSTNSAVGSAEMSLDRFLAFSGRDPALAERSTTLAVGSAALIDAQPGAAIIEAGIDLAVDSGDRLFVLEVNVRPMTTTAEQDRAEGVIAYLASRFDRLARPDARAGRVEETRE